MSVDNGSSMVESSTIVSNNQGTIDEIVEIGQSIYQDVLKYSKDKRKKIVRFVNAYNDDGPLVSGSGKVIHSRNHKGPVVSYGEEKIEQLNDDDFKTLIAILREKYRDFNVSFPVIMRWTAQMGEYSKKAMSKFLLKYSKTKMKSMDDFLELQKDYVIFLYQEKNPHWNTRVVANMATNLVTALKKEEKEFEEASEEVQKEIDEIEKQNTLDRRRLIYDEIVRQKAAEAAEAAEVTNTANTANTTDGIVVADKEIKTYNVKNILANVSKKLAL